MNKIMENKMRSFKAFGSFFLGMLFIASLAPVAFVCFPFVVAQEAWRQDCWPWGS